MSLHSRRILWLALLAALALNCISQPVKQPPQTHGPAQQGAAPERGCPVNESARTGYFNLRASVDDAEWTAGLSFLLSPTQARRDELLRQLRNPAESPGKRLVALEYLSAESIALGRIPEAVTFWSTQPRIRGLEQWSDCVISLLKSPREQVKLVPLEGDVNSPLAEYDAEPDLSGKRMFFTRIDVKGERKPPGEEIWFAELVDGKWRSRPVSELNTPTHESVLASSLDGSRIFVFGNYSGSSNGDIFISRLTKTGWSKPERLPAPVNTEYFESDTRPTPDGKAILFASDRPGGPYEHHPRQSKLFAGSTQGNTDLYISFISRDGVYSQPVNLGTQINTPGAERNPFLHADGKTMYFASNGHPGIGDMDIFRTVRLDDTWTRWSPPENLGPQINTAGSDSGFRLTGHGEEGLIGSLSFSGSNSSDIFRVVPVPQRFRPATEISLLRGEVKDPKGSPVEADVLWRNAGSSEEEGRSRSRPDTGEYIVPLPRDRKFEIELKKEGFFKQSFAIDTGKPEMKTKDPEVPVVLRADPAYRPPVAADRSMPQTAPRRENARPTPALPRAAIVYFSASGLKMTNPQALAPLIAFLKANPRAMASITAHTDGSGDPQFNRNLSERRARSIYNYLVARGIAPSRINYRGAGEGRPAATNRTRRGRQMNRRAVVKIEIPAPQRGNR